MKIIVIGSPGAGKSYFSKRLCEKLNIPVYHLDNIYWNADKTHISRELLRIKVDEIMKTDNWLIDGNYISTMEQRISGADKIILFDCETEVCIDGVISRVGASRTDMPWIEEKMDTDFLEYVKAFKEKSLPEIKEKLKLYPDKELIVFHTRKEADIYLANTKLLSSTLNTRPILKNDYRYIRSDIPVAITEDDKKWLLNNNIRTIIDLRTKEEQQSKPCPLMKMKEFEYYSIPLSGGREVPEKPSLVPISYMNMVDENLDYALDIAINSAANVLYFCNLGKDRTGVLSAMILKKLGKSNEYIISDYTKTYDNVKMVLKTYVESNPHVDINVITPKAEYMSRFLKMLERTGGSETMLFHKGTQKIHTKRLILRKYNLSDSKNMFKNYAGDERVTKYLSWKAYKKSEDIREFLQASIKEYEKESTYHWAIEYEGEIIGSISVMSVDDLRNSCEVGYCIGYDYWNKGITSEALAAVIKYLFEEIGMHRILAKHDVENPASGEVMKKCGMTYEGRFKEYYLRHDGTYSDAMVYGIVND